MSEIDTRAFFSAVLKAIACTRNNNADQSGYAAGVLEPAAAIRAFEKDLGDKPLTRPDAERVLAWLDSVFRTKLTPAEEREHYLGRIAELSGLSLVRTGA
ncbi:hypothetical protein [Actinokineospora cianjurensis]|uniref:Uncharacterized protein n=1 Tax=Actinokineospora cianjurensis TaxID=585224 RepID=A0A421B0Y9_9PSEU|nr:hypothetical protein [Actinokineospora cianjurensis]RLK57953.1 hypothetical protein CLV68_4043 [Actinokineospora cianjurensis]